MDVLSEILNWSRNRPDWQRDALRRLVVSGELQDADHEELIAICKSSHGLEEKQNLIPLAKSHISDDGRTSGAIKLIDITHHDGVNALAQGQSVSFGPGLTVVYGDNASGKSGYTRILKSACQARGAEEILGNVLSGTAPPAPSASIRFTEGDDETLTDWPSGTESDDSLRRVSVFDSHSAAVYLSEKTDVAFRPFGLDLFDKLSDVCGRVQKGLERDRRALGPSVPMPDLPEGTAAHALVTSLSSLTKRESVTILGALSEADQAKLALLEKQKVDLQSNNPVKTATELTLRSERFQSLKVHLKQIDSVLSIESLQDLFTAQQEAQVKRKVASTLRKTAFPKEMLTGTGSSYWKTMWETARAFSEKKAYAGKPFPVTIGDAQCVLCQQDLDAQAATRLEQFETYVLSFAETESKEAATKFTTLFTHLNDLQVTNEQSDKSVSEIRIEQVKLADDIDSSLSIALQRKTAVIQAINSNAGMPPNLPELIIVKDEVVLLTQQLDQRAKGLLSQADQDHASKIRVEFNELKAREIVGINQNLLLGEIDRKAKLAAYGLCLDDTRTNAITRKSTDITKEAVTKQLKQSFLIELKKLGFKHVEVELQEAGGERGTFYHKLVLKRAPNLDVPKVVSEGEARCLSIAAFFAELSTADDQSTILFDDPVSSLDHKWRRSVAERLVEEAKSRQVVVFTHDIVFLLSLREHVGQEGIDIQDQHLRRENFGTGVCEKRLPWAATKVSARIKILNHDSQAAGAKYRNGDRRAYERDAIMIYGLLRESWERALEEILLCGVVERYRQGVQTGQIRSLADISIEDCDQLEAGMTKCSRWLPGHDQAGAENEEIPDPDELNADVKALDNWVNSIRTRR